MCALHWLYNSVVVGGMVRAAWWTKPDKFVGITFMMFSWNRAIHFCWTSKAKETCFVISCYHYIAHDINGGRQGKRRWALCPCVVRLENWWAKKRSNIAKLFLYWIKKSIISEVKYVHEVNFLLVYYIRRRSEWQQSIMQDWMLWRWCVFESMLPIRESSLMCVCVHNGYGVTIPHISTN